MTEPATVPPERALDSGLSAALLAAAAGCIGWALQRANGAYEPDALMAVTLAIVCAAAAVLFPRFTSLGAGWGDGPAVGVLGAALVWSFWTLGHSLPGIYLHVRDLGHLMEYLAGLPLAALFCGAVLSRRPWLGLLSFLGLLAVHFFLGDWLLHASSNPFIDVFVFHRNAFEALRHGIDPYALDNPNIYGNSMFYGEGLVQGGRLLVGYPYPPLSLLLGWLGDAVAGDYRYVNLVAMELAAVFMAFSRPGRLGKAAAAAFLFTPRVFFVLEQGWTEPLIVLFFAGCVFLACRRPRWTAWGLGLLLAIKQHLVLVLGLAHLLWPGFAGSRAHLARLGRAVALAAVITVPFALWNLAGFWRSVVMFQIRQPFRMDALSYLAWLVRSGGPQLPSAVAFAAALALLVLGALWARWTPAGFAAASALMYAVFFALSKQAFCNYDFFVLGLLCTGVAATLPAFELGGD